MSSRTTLPRAADGRNLVATTLLCVSSVLAPLAVHSQALSGDGYLFHRPTGSLSIRGGWSQPNANSDIFSHARRNLTLDRTDFGSANVIADVGVRVSNRFSVQFSGGYSGRTADSEMRDFVDNKDQPIAQSTKLIRAPFLAGLRFDLTNPGRSIGRLAYIPSRFTPYVSAGAGAMYYKFRQSGSFKDDNSFDIFDDVLETSGTAFASYGALGADLTLTPVIALTTEARYDAARPRTSDGAFSTFRKTDMSGVSATIGITFRY
ncbi:MAG: outer membrane beta-barrel protein [Gemmatimonadaceae bacterium]